MPKKQYFHKGNVGDYAVVIGLNHYKEMDPLNGSIRDAVDFTQWLLAPSGGFLPPQNIAFINSIPAHKPLKDEIDEVMVRLLDQAAAAPGNRRRIYMFFAGHGAIGSRGNRDVAMLMLDWNKRFSRAAMDGAAYRDELGRVPRFSEVVAIHDCCRSQMPAVEGQPPKFKYNGSAALRVVEIYAAAPASKSYDVGAGLFTSVFLAALMGRAASPSGGVNHDVLQQHLNRDMASVCHQAELPALTPVVVPSVPGPPLVFGSAHAADAPNTIVHLKSTGAADLVSIRSGGKETLVETFPGPGRWLRKLPPGAYALRRPKLDERFLVTVALPGESAEQGGLAYADDI